MPSSLRREWHAAHSTTTSFYIYFKSCSEAALAVRRAYAAMIRSRMPRRLGSRRAYQKYLIVDQSYCATYARKACLLAGHEAFMRDQPALARTRDFINDRWARALIRSLRGRRSLGLGLTRGKRELRATRMVISMADEILREAYIHRGQKLVGLSDDPNVIAEMLSKLWHRALLGRDPSMEESGETIGSTKLNREPLFLAKSSTRCA